MQFIAIVGCWENGLVKAEESGLSQPLGLVLEGDECA